MDERNANKRRFWSGVGLFFLGIVVAIVTYISIIGPIIGLVMMGMGVWTIVWAVGEPEDASKLPPGEPRPR